MDPSHKQVMLHMIRMKNWAPNFVTSAYLHIPVSISLNTTVTKKRMNECLLYSHIPFSTGSHSKNTQISFFSFFLEKKNGS